MFYLGDQLCFRLSASDCFFLDQIMDYYRLSDYPIINKSDLMHRVIMLACRYIQDDPAI